MKTDSAGKSRSEGAQMFRLIRYAVRQLWRSPGFAVTAVLTLALGIGTSTAMFAVLDAVLLRPLPFAEPDRLVAVEPVTDGIASVPTMLDYQSRSHTFESLAAYRQWSPAQRAADGSPATGTAAHQILAVSQGFVSTLGARFALGTSWPMTGNEQDCPGQVIVSGGYWKRLGGDSRELGGKVLNLDGRDFQVAGVLPVEQEIEGLYGFNQPEVFAPIGCDKQERPAERGDSGFQLMGRLRPGVTIAQAKADLVRVDQTLLKDYPTYYGSGAGTRRSIKVLPYIELLVGAQTKPALLTTLAACGLLLLIACANLANLLLARNTRRRGELATRATLGATLGQLMRQLMVESAVLVGLGASCGVALALLVLKVLKSATDLHLPRLAHASISPAVLGFILLVSGVVTCLLTILPAGRILRPRLLEDLPGGGRSSSGKSLRLAGRVLVVAQLTLTLILVACAGWMVSGVYVLLHQPLGFTPDRLLMLQVVLGSHDSNKKDAAQYELKLTQIAASLGQLPGVRSVAFTDHQPLGHAVNRYDFCSDWHPEQCEQRVNVNPNSYAISEGYFSTLGQALLQGRDFNSTDSREGGGRNHVAIVNKALAEREWPGQSALGHRIHTGEIKEPDDKDKLAWATVVGVVGNVHNYDLVSEPGPDLYIPRAEDPSGYARFILNVSGDPGAFPDTVRHALKASYPEAAVSRVHTFAEEMSSEVSERVFLMQVAMAFGGIALFLSILGSYGLLAYEVSLREKEIGIRLALGSSRERIVGLLLKEEGRWLALGGVLGIAGAIATGYLLRAEFYGVRSTSPVVLAGAALLLLGPALIAILVPASRAAFLEPAETLRRE